MAETIGYDGTIKQEARPASIGATVTGGIGPEGVGRIAAAHPDWGQVAQNVVEAGRAYLGYKESVATTDHKNASVVFSANFDKEIEKERNNLLPRAQAENWSKEEWDKQADEAYRRARIAAAKATNQLLGKCYDEETADYYDSSFRNQDMIFNERAKQEYLKRSNAEYFSYSTAKRKNDTAIGNAALAVSVKDLPTLVDAAWAYNSADYTQAGVEKINNTLGTIDMFTANELERRKSEIEELTTGKEFQDKVQEFHLKGDVDGFNRFIEETNNGIELARKDRDQFIQDSLNHSIAAIDNAERSGLITTEEATVLRYTTEQKADALFKQADEDAKMQAIASSATADNVKGDNSKKILSVLMDCYQSGKKPVPILGNPISQFAAKFDARISDPVPRFTDADGNPDKLVPKADVSEWKAYYARFGGEAIVNHRKGVECNIAFLDMSNPDAYEKVIELYEGFKQEWSKYPGAEEQVKKLSMFIKTNIASTNKTLDNSKENWKELLKGAIESVFGVKKLEELPIETRANIFNYIERRLPYINEEPDALRRGEKVEETINGLRILKNDANFFASYNDLLTPSGMIGELYSPFIQAEYKYGEDGIPRYADGTSAVEDGVPTMKEVEEEEKRQDKIRFTNKLVELANGGRVNLLNRPVVGAKTLHAAGWNKVHDFETVYPQVYSNEDHTKAVLLTPILPDGKVVSCFDLEGRAKEILAGKMDGADGVLLGVFRGKEAEKIAKQKGKRIDLAVGIYKNEWGGGFAKGGLRVRLPGVAQPVKTSEREKTIK